MVFPMVYWLLLQEMDMTTQVQIQEEPDCI